MRWGIVGAGRIAKKVGAALAATPGHRVAAVWARRFDAAQALAAGFDAWATDAYPALLQSGQCDAIYIALPNHLHAPYAIEAARAGLHVLVEKPLVSQASEYHALRAAATAQGVVVAEGMMYQHHPQTVAVRALIAAGAIGAVQQIQVGFGYRQDNPYDIRMTEHIGGGAIADLGCYAIHFAQLIAGAPVRTVVAQGSIGGNDVDVQSSAVCLHANGVQATHSVSFVGGFHQSARIIGYDGVIEIERPFTIFPDRESSFVLWRGAHFAQREVHTVAPCHHFVVQAEAFAEAVAAPAAERGGWVDGDSYTNALVLDAWRTAMRRGSCVTVD